MADDVFPRRTLTPIGICGTIYHPCGARDVSPGAEPTSIPSRDHDWDNEWQPFHDDLSRFRESRESPVVSTRVSTGSHPVLHTAHAGSTCFGRVAQRGATQL